MKRIHSGGLRTPKRQKLQMSIRSMILNNGPKFTESLGLQPCCRYCGRKFKAAQGLSAHLLMHERAGDVMPSSELARNPAHNQPLLARPHPVSRPVLSGPPVHQEHKSPIKIEDDVQIVVPARPAVFSMTRRFTIAEKIRIIDKYKSNRNISATCRWVQMEFNRMTFDRKSLRKMVSREKIFRKAAGTKRVRKTVRSRTGYFHRMDKKLAE